MSNWRHRELGQLPKFTQTEVEEWGFKPRPSDPRACSQQQVTHFNDWAGILAIHKTGRQNVASMKEAREERVKKNGVGFSPRRMVMERTGCVGSQGLWAGFRFLQEELTKQINERSISSVRMSTPLGQGFAMFTAASPVPRQCRSNAETGLWQYRIWT